MASAAKVKVLFSLLLVALVILVFFLEARRRSAEAALKQMSVRLEQLQGGNTQQNQEVAKQIVAKVRKHIDVTSDTEPTVAQIVDVNALRQKNSFYDKATNGDYLVITPTRAILYSPTKDVVVDVIPVQISPDAGTGATASSRGRSVARP